MSRYIIRIRYSLKNELLDGKKYLLFEQYNRKAKSWEIIKMFELEYEPNLRQYIMPVEVLTYIRHLSDMNYEIFYDYLSNT